jgi:hypothetical protein
MDQKQENHYGSRRWLIPGPFLTEMDIQTPFVPTRMDRKTLFSRKSSNDDWLLRKSLQLFQEPPLTLGTLWL